jgi:ribosome biogenesis GTPase / thiamine phosphate phosphatase
MKGDVYYENQLVYGEVSLIFIWAGVPPRPLCPETRISASTLPGVLFYILNLKEHSKMNHMDITMLGWDGFFEEAFSACRLKGFIPARVVSRSGVRYGMLCETGECYGSLSGKYLHRTGKGGELPVAGDWVAVQLKGEDAVIQALLERKSCFSRKPAISGGRKISNGMIVGGSTTRQTLAANIDFAFIVSAMDGNFSIPGLERYLTAASAGNVTPVIVLNKLDLCTDTGPYFREAGRLAEGCPVHAVSAATGSGLDAMATYLKPGATVAFLGPSGAGKSTLINRLFGSALQRTNAVNDDTGKGRHTTTMAELLLHESGCMLIDTPGIRELQLWCDGKDVQDNFNDVVEIIRRCRFSDCRHGNEPGCAVQEALKGGSLDDERYQSYLKLYSEASRLKALKKQRDIWLGRMDKYSK